MMTDEQIIKALECCTIDGEKDCFNCAETNWVSCKTTLMKQALDLIDRQKAEIEQLRHRDEELLLKNHTFDKYYNEHITKAKSEAIKEFAERLTVKLDNEALTEFEMYDGYDIQDTKRAIVNLVKEMTESEGE